MPRAPRPLALLDRDGTVIADRHYLDDPAGVAFCPNAPEGLRRLEALGFRLVLVTNQSGIARGRFDWEALEAVQAEVIGRMVAEGLHPGGSYICPHGPEDGCPCRKPAPGLAEQALRDHHTTGAEAVVIGDKAADVDLGKAIGATTILVRTGKGAETEAKGACTPDHVAADLRDAARWLEEKRA